MSEAITWLTIFVLAAFVGVEVISKVSSTLHTPLMSGANAIHGVILVGAIVVAGHRRVDPGAGAQPGRRRAGRDQHGRWVRGHRPDAADVRPQAAARLRHRAWSASRTCSGSVEPSPPRRDGSTVGLVRCRPGGARDAGVGAAGLPGGGGLLHRGAEGPVVAADGPARQPDRCGRCGAGLRDRLPGQRPRPSRLDPDRGRRRHRDRRARRVPGADDPDAAAGRPVQRGRRRGGGDRGAGRAGGGVPGRVGAGLRPDRHGLHHRGRVGQLHRVDGHLPQAAGADDRPADHLRRLPDPVRVRAGLGDRASRSAWCWCRRWSSVWRWP